MAKDNEIPPTQTNKRKKGDESDDSDAIQSSTSSKLLSTPRFLVITSQDQSRTVSSLSPFVIEKSIQAIAGHPKSIKKLKSGDLLLEVEREQQVKNLLSTNQLFDLKVNISLHKSLNTCKGVIRSTDLRPCSEEHIIANLKDQGVIGVRNISVRRNGALKTTDTYVLTFNTPQLPTKIKIAYLSVKVEVYIPNPLRCYNCQIFGHHESKCVKDPLCPKCGEKKHCTDARNCEKEAKCVNCGGKHAVFSRECSAWTKEKEILRIKYQRSISFPEARKIVQELDTTLTRSYASVTKSTSVQTCSSATQTVESCIEELKKSGAWSKSTPSPQSRDRTSRGTAPDALVRSTEPRPEPHVKEKSDTGRIRKGSEDPIQTHNRFGSLADEGMDAEDTPPSPRKGAKLTRVPTSK